MVGKQGARLSQNLGDQSIQPFSVVADPDSTEFNDAEYEGI